MHNNTSIYKEEKVKLITFGKNTNSNSIAESPYKNSKIDDIVLSPEKVMQKKDFLKRSREAYDP